MTETQNKNELLNLTTEIVTAHLANNTVQMNDVPQLIETVFNTLNTLGNGTTGMGERPQPAVAIKKSVQDDYIVCLEDGKKLKMLKRHLMSAYNMTPEQYRERWGLPSDYPMVAPNYAKKRSELAKTIGLGKTGSKKKTTPKKSTAKKKTTKQTARGRKKAA